MGNGKKLKVQPLSRGQIKSLLESVEFNKQTNCWEWTGYKNKDGYGVVCRKCDDKTIQVKAHRFIYAWICGDIPAGLVVRHSCNNPACVNPEHLLLGTVKENAEDMVKIGHSCKGTKHPNCKINENVVLKIFDLAKQGFSCVKIGKQVGLGKTRVQIILSGKGWTHVKRDCSLIS